jgi:hypothetical protein
MTQRKPVSPPELEESIPTPFPFDRLHQGALPVLARHRDREIAEMTPVPGGSWLWSLELLQANTI